ncbi:MAG: hypothetical protein HUU31_14585 [Anaerolineae bacterium]|nr:hypothetical protein [Anaerolineae bacterium]
MQTNNLPVSDNSQTKDTYAETLKKLKMIASIDAEGAEVQAEHSYTTDNTSYIDTN